MWLVESGFEKMGWARGSVSWDVWGMSYHREWKTPFGGCPQLATLLMPPDSVLPTLLRNLELVLGKYQSSVFCLGQGLMPELLIGSGSLGMLFFCSNVWAECRAFCSLG